MIALETEDESDGAEAQQREIYTRNLHQLGRPAGIMGS